MNGYPHAVKRHFATKHHASLRYTGRLHDYSSHFSQYAKLDQKLR